MLSFVRNIEEIWLYKSVACNNLFTRDCGNYRAEDVSYMYHTFTASVKLPLPLEQSERPHVLIQRLKITLLHYKNIHLDIYLAMTLSLMYSKDCPRDYQRIIQLHTTLGNDPFS